MTHPYALALVAVEHQVYVLGVQVLHGYLCREAMGLGQRIEQAVEPRARRARPHPRLDGSLTKGHVLIRDDVVRVDLQPVSEAGAGRAGAVGVVEAEGARLELTQADVAVYAGELLRKEQLIAVLDVDQDSPPGQLESGFDRVGDPGRFGAVPDHQPVDDDLHGVPLLLVQVEVLREVVGLAVDPDANKSRLPCVLEDLFMFALSPANHRRHDLDAGTLVQSQDGVYDLLYGLGARPACHSCSSGVCPLWRTAVAGSRRPR